MTNPGWMGCAGESVGAEGVSGKASMVGPQEKPIKDDELLLEDVDRLKELAVSFAALGRSDIGEDDWKKTENANAWDLDSSTEGSWSATDPSA